jgi:hypothetical protein
MLTLATSYPFLNILLTILIYMALVIWYRIAAPIEHTEGLAHGFWLATCQIEVAVTLILGFEGITEHTVEVHRSRTHGSCGTQSPLCSRWASIRWS